MNVDVFFEGGGILGISFIGAYKALSDHGILIDRAIGISSGSIIAAFIKSGFTANELIQLLSDYDDFTFFKQKTSTAKKNYIGKPLSLLLNKGIYDSAVIEKFMDEILKQKNITTFQSLMWLGESKLKIIAADFTNKRLLLLPDDLPSYGYDKNSFQISKAVRMSCCIPFFYTPYELKSRNSTCYIIDGGVIKQISTSILNQNHNLDKLTLRFKIKDNSNRWINRFKDIKNRFEFKHDTNNNERIIMIHHNGKIKATDFDISKEEIIYLYKQGYKACYRFIKSEFYKLQ